MRRYHRIAMHLYYYLDGRGKQHWWEVEHYWYSGVG